MLTLIFFFKNEYIQFPIFEIFNTIGIYGTYLKNIFIFSNLPINSKTIILDLLSLVRKIK